MATETRTGEKSSAIFARRGPTDQNVTDRKKFWGRRYAVTNFGHDEDSDSRESRALRGGRADTFGERGSLWGSGPIGMEIPAGGEGYMDILHSLLGEPTPVSTPIPDKTLVAAGTDVSDVVAAKYFRDTADATVKVVDAQTLSGDDEKSVVENLGTYTDALTLSVTPDSDADLTSSTTDGTITITYTDANGETQAIARAFADAAKTTAQMVNLPSGAIIKTVEATGWSAGKFDITTEIAADIVRNPDSEHPGKLRFEFSDANVGGKITVRGLRKIGLRSDDTLRLKETIELSETAAETMDVSLSQYFHKIGKVEIVDASGTAFTIGTVKITASPGGYKTVMPLVDTLSNGLDIEGEVGGEPRTIRKGVVIGGEIDISNTIGITVNILSRRVDKRKTIDGDPFEEQFIPTAVLHPDEFPFVTERFFTDIGAYLELDGEATIFDSAPIVIAHNYDFDDGKTGSPFRDDLAPDSRRNVTTNIATSYRAGTSEEDKFIRWDEKFRNKEPVSARIATYQWLTNGEQVAVIYDLGYCEVTAPVRVEASGPGKIPITVALKAVPNPATGEQSEITVTIIGQDQWI